MKALVVDDEEHIGLLLSKILIKNGIEADYVCSIKEGQQKIQSSHYDIFYLDLNLPDGTGFDLIPLIRSQLIDFKIVIISAYDGITEMQKAKEMKVDVFVKKPFTKTQIIETISR